MSTGNHMYTLEDFYQFLLSHDLVAKVLQYREVYCYMDDSYKCVNNPLFALFAWDKTNEGDNYWHNLSKSYPMKLEPTSVQDIMLYLHTRIPRPETPYEYW